MEKHGVAVPPLPDHLFCCCLHPRAERLVPIGREPPTGDAARRK